MCNAKFTICELRAQKFQGAGVPPSSVRCNGPTKTFFSQVWSWHEKRGRCMSRRASVCWVP